MVCSGHGSRQDRTKSNIAVQNLQNFILFLFNFGAALIVNSAHVG